MATGGAAQDGHGSCGPFKESCLHRLIFVSERSLREAIGSSSSTYHHERNHQGLSLSPRPRWERFRSVAHPIERSRNLGDELVA